MSWKKYPTKQQLGCHLPLISQTIQVRWKGNAGHCYRSKEELISNFLLWTLTHGHSSVGRPARIYMHQFCVDTECCLEDLPRVMDEWDGWWEKVREICAVSITFWWWWWWWWLQKKFYSDILSISTSDFSYINIAIYFYNSTCNDFIFSTCFWSMFK